MDAFNPNPARDLFLWDREAKGFVVRVKPTGVKSFVLAYYAPGLHQVRRRITLGTYGLLSPEEPRKRALALLARVASGEDPT